MQEKRLNGVALLYINNDIELDYNQVINQFAKGNRRHNLKYTDFVLRLIFIFRFHFSNKFRKRIILKLASRMHEMRIFGCNFAKFSRGMLPGHPGMVVPSALSIKLICDVTIVTQLWPLLGNFLRKPLLLLHFFRFTPST